MLSRWIEGWSEGCIEGDLAVFRREIWGQTPLARPGAAGDVVERCRWPTLHAILARRPDMLLAEAGHRVDRPEPTDADSVAACFAAGLGLVVRRAERHDSGLADLAREIGRELNGEVHIQLFAGPPGQRSFGWHFDAEQVLTVQTESCRR